MSPCEEKNLADARKIWVMEVLDEHLVQTTTKTGRLSQQVTGVAVAIRGNLSWSVGFSESGNGVFGDTPYAARLAAALAVYPELTAVVRAKLGECP